MKNRTLNILAVAWVGVAAGCMFPSRTPTYDRAQVGRTMHIESGEVTAVRDIVVGGQTNGTIGVTGGGLVGQAAASGGSGTKGAMARAGGAVVGAVAGSAVEEVATRRAAQEITLRLDSGEEIAVVQELKNGRFAVGERLEVLESGSATTLRRPQ